MATIQFHLFCSFRFVFHRIFVFNQMVKYENS